MEYISTSNASITIGVTPLGGTTTTYGPTGCTTTTCTISFTATSGPNTLTFTFTNAGGVTLSKFIQFVFVGPQNESTLNFTGNPVVNSVTLTLGTTTPPAGTRVKIPLAVNALDAGGNVIVGTGNYVDSSGDPLALSVNVSTAQAGGRGVTYLIGPTSLTTPSQGGLYASYNGGWLAQSTFSVSSSSSIVGSLGTATLIPTPTATEFSNGITGTTIIGITAGADGNLWAAEYGGNKILRMTTAGIGTEFSAGITAGGSPHCITSGPDGNIWFTEFNGNRIGRITPSGTISEFTGMTAANPVKIITGPDGNLWFTETLGGRVGKITTQGLITDYPSSLWVRAIAIGPDGNLWDNSARVATIDQITTSGALITYTYTSGGTSSGMDGMVTGPDGNLWFIDESTASLHRYVLSTGTFTTFTTGLGAGANILDIIIGPDNALWFSDQFNNTLDRIDPNTGIITTYSAGISAGAGVRDIIIGSDGNIWFTEQTKNRIGKFVF